MRVAAAFSDHFSVDGTLIESYASIKSFVSKDESDRKDGDDRNGYKSRNAEVNFHGQKRGNTTHHSTTDPEARLYKKSRGQEAKLAYLGHTMVENRNGMIASAMVTQATGTAEREAA